MREVLNRRGAIALGTVVLGVATSAWGQCGSGGSCYSEHGPGCDDQDCCIGTCLYDPVCCTQVWDSTCVSEALFFCQAHVITGPIINPANLNHYYVVSSSTWLKCQQVAASIGGHLATIANAGENFFLRFSIVQPQGGYAMYIGFNDIASEGNWVWPTGQPVTFTNWALDEPNNVGNIENVAQIYSNGEWADIHQWEFREAIVEVEKTGCGDFEAGNCFVQHGSPYCSDAACCEYVCSFDPFCCSNQWDSVCANEASVCAVVPQTQPMINPGTGKSYQRLTPVGRQFAESYAATFGYKLASVHSGVENEWIRRTLLMNAPGQSQSPAWLSLNDVASEGNFVWTDGKPVNYTHWAPGEPNNAGGNEDGTILSTNGLWNDLGVTSAVSAIIENGFTSCGTGGSCFTVNGASGCGDEACCNTVCSFDPACCFTSWDADCVSQANAYCNPPVVFGPIVNPKTRHSYYVLDSAVWPQAEHAANLMGGSLVVPNTAAELTWIKLNMMTSSPNPQERFIGLHDQAVEGFFQAITFEPFVTQWAPGEPNDYGNGEDFSSLLASGLMNDVGFSVTKQAIIEVPCQGDLNNSGNVDAADLAIMLGDWGPVAKPSDINADGVVDGADLGILLGGWGQCPSSNACFPHGPGSDQPACTSCVCNLDPFCCNNAWDSLCVQAASTTCNAACQCGS